MYLNFIIFFVPFHPPAPLSKPKVRSRELPINTLPTPYQLLINSYHSRIWQGDEQEGNSRFNVL